MYLDDDGSSEHILYYVLTHFVHIIHTVGKSWGWKIKGGLFFGFYAVKKHNDIHKSELLIFHI